MVNAIGCGFMWVCLYRSVWFGMMGLVYVGRGGLFWCVWFMSVCVVCVDGCLFVSIGVFLCRWVWFIWVGVFFLDGCSLGRWVWFVTMGVVNAGGCGFC